MSEWLDEVVRLAQVALTPTNASARPFDLQGAHLLGESAAEGWDHRIPITGITGTGLYLPGSIQPLASDISLMSMTAAYMTIEVLLGVSIEHDEIENLLGEHEVEAVLTECSLLLAQLYEGRSPGDRTVQRRLAETCLLGEARTKALTLLEDDDWVFLSPQAVLGAMKLRLLGDSVPTTQTPRMGVRTATIAAVLALASELENADREDVERLGRLPRSLAMEIFSNQLFNRNLDLGAEIARFKRHRSLVHEKFPAEAEKYDRLFSKYTGTTVEALFCVGCYAILQQRQDRVVQMPPALFYQLDFADDVIRSAIGLLATSQDRLSELVREDDRRLDFAWSFNALRRYPMLELQDGNLLILDPAFVVSRALSTAYFWEIKSKSIDVIEEDEGDVPEAKRILGGFSGFIGHGAEEYVSDRLSQIDAPSGVIGKRVWREHEIQELRAERDPSKTCDFILDYGSAWIAIDVVTSRVSQRATEASSYTDLDADINDIVIAKAEQIESTIQWLISLEGSVPGQKIRSVRPRYFPLIVAFNGFPWNEVMAEEVHTRLRARKLLQDPMINPLVVIDVRELEYIETAAERGLIFGALLEDVMSESKGVHPMGWYLARRTGLSWPKSLNQPLDEAFQELGDSVKEEYRIKPQP